MARWNHRTCAGLNILSTKVELAAGSVLELLHDFHHAARHEIRPVDAIVLLAVLAEADEDGVDGHLVDGQEAVDDEERENDAQHDRNELQLNGVVSLEEKFDEMEKLEVNSKILT